MSCPSILPALLALCGATALAAAQEPPPAPAGQDPGQQQAPRRAEPMPVPRSLVKRRGDRKIHIDGSLQDWPSAPPLLLDDGRQLSGTAVGAWRGPADLAARVFLLWDDEDLFVAAVVRDDWHRPLTKDAPRLQEIPPADNLMLTFDPDRDTRSLGRDEGRREDREFWLADVQGQGRRLVLWDRYRGIARFANGAVSVVKNERERGLTTYEARIPWKEILPPGRKPAERMVLRLRVVVSDFDALTDPIAQTRTGWTFGTGARIDPGVMGSVMLVGDLDAAVEKLPEFPPAPELKGDPVPDRGYWARFYEKLQQSPPRRVLAGSGPPQEAGGLERLEKLVQLEHHIAGFPRVDFLEYHHRVHRRMRREVAGMTMSGLPFFWQHVLADISRRASGKPPERGFRVFRLPQGGWLVRSAVANFAIDPAGYGVGHALWGALDFVLLTDPGQFHRRNDQLLLRLAAAQRQYLTHRPFHVPGVDATKMPLVEIGKTYPLKGLKIAVLGTTAEGSVSRSVGYAVGWPDGSVLVCSSQAATPDNIAPTLAPDGVPDLLLLSAYHPQAVALGKAVRARLTVLDDVLQCAIQSGPDARVSLDDAFALQTALRPLSSMLLAPGESVDVAAPK